MCLLKDNMKKESKKFILLIIICYAFSIIMPIAIILTKNEFFQKLDIILISLFCFMIGSILLYCWLYAIRYSVEVTEEKVILKTLFRKVDIDFKNITDYSNNRYKKSVFYQFRLFTKDKTVLVNIRYRNEFIEILKGKVIKESN